MRSLRMSLLWKLVFLSSFCFLFNKFSEAHSHQRKLLSAVVVGTVYCDTCFHQDFSKSTHFISGATVAVECKDNSCSTNSRPSFTETVKTNENGEFKVNLPSSASKHMKKIKNCSVKLISSNELFCALASSATSIHLKSRKERTHFFSAAFFTFKPLKLPELCDPKNYKKLGRKTYELVVSNNNNMVAQIRPNQFLPFPPFLPPLPFPPLLPGLTPSPPPKSILHFPFQPIPGFPGVPPAVSSKKSNP